jgi:RNA-directed DNA polymerase
VVNGTLAIAQKALKTAMSKVKALTPRGAGKTLEATLKSINQWYVDWSNYYSLSNYPSQLAKIEAHIRRRLRARLIYQQKRKKCLYWTLVERGVSRKAAAETVFSSQKRWALSKSRAATKTYPNSWFINLKGQAIRSNQNLEHWFDVSQWVYLA